MKKPYKFSPIKSKKKVFLKGYFIVKRANTKKDVWDFCLSGLKKLPQQIRIIQDVSKAVFQVLV